MDTKKPALERANDLIGYLLTALDNINRNDSIHYAHGAAEHAIEHAR